MTLSDLIARPGPRPQTHYDIPHQQTSDNPSAELHAGMASRFLAAPGTSTGPSLISVPGARALFLDGDGPDNPDVFFRGREFAHIHPESDGSFHMILSFADAELVVDRQWGELHPWAASGRLGPNVVMIYAPRSAAEVDTIAAIADAARRHAIDHGASIPCPCHDHA